MDAKHGFVLTRIGCSGCYEDTNPLRKVVLLKEELVPEAVAQHNSVRGKCPGGKLRIEYSPCLIVDVDPKP